MWRKLLAKVHPDSAGDHELFIWAMNVRDVVCHGGHAAATATTPPPRQQEHRTTPDAVPFDRYADFDELTRRAVALADEVPAVFGVVLRLLSDCRIAYTGSEEKQQRKGATYKQLAAIGHAVGMSKQERTQWYRIAEQIPLSVRHAGHILGKLRGGD